MGTACRPSRRCSAAGQSAPFTFIWFIINAVVPIVQVVSSTRWSGSWRANGIAASGMAADVFNVIGQVTWMIGFASRDAHRAGFAADGAFAAVDQQKRPWRAS
jgi:hypothetical protein